ncbi:hypothetical protein NDU88_006521 [Pleurodeles waltl]|uniref:Uncharacterized protein n=1 Tax=Pleurodeles waltl TaxID=8319 RepID=A0AAV7WAV2_PLEWA|nr:hypothetical protein NDU88_006521 [Pleurodeles waltl]
MLGGGADTPQQHSPPQENSVRQRKGPPRAPRPLTRAAASPATRPRDATGRRGATVPLVQIRIYQWIHIVLDK